MINTKTDGLRGNRRDEVILTRHFLQCESDMSNLVDDAS